MMNLKLEYEQDFHQWIEHHILLLREGKFNEIDSDHLIEELSEMSKSNRQQLVSRLIVLIAHLLKWQYQYHQLVERFENWKGHSWKSTLVEQRIQIDVLLQDSPSLKNALQESIIKAYPNALKLAMKDTGLPQSVFPISCPYTFQQLFDDDFYPETQ